MVECRFLDGVLYVPEEDAYYIYYSGTTGSVQDRIGLAICPAGADGYSGVTAAAITRYGTGPVLAPEPAAPFHEEMVSQAAVLRNWDATAPMGLVYVLLLPREGRHAPRYPPGHFARRQALDAAVQRPRSAAWGRSFARRRTPTTSGTRRSRSIRRMSSASRWA